MEDALKHLYDCEYKKLSCTQQSLSGALSISGDRAARLLGRLESTGLLRSEGEGFVLTEDGRSYALRIIRIHRLWERHLADETGVVETEWHPDAEKQEHKMTSDQADTLEAQLGNPRYDPHGDPIPTASGDIPARKGQPLTDLSPGRMGQIVHIEDEPGAVYAQLVARGLYAGAWVRVTGTSNEGIRFDTDGVEHTLPPVIAANVTVAPGSPDSLGAGRFDTLDVLEPGEQGTVIAISKACRGVQRRRLLDLGLVPGTVISAEMRSPSGDPVAYSVRGATIALRRKQARMIKIRRGEAYADHM
jgi:DtxR family Mn-dependent transcriptional regulator